MVTEIERKALALVNEVSIREWTDFTHADPWTLHQALCRAIQQHEAFRQEVSDAVEAAKRTYGGHRQAFDQLERFILPKPDPLVEALGELADRNLEARQAADTLRAALAARGLKIVEDK